DLLPALRMDREHACDEEPPGSQVVCEGEAIAAGELDAHEHGVRAGTGNGRQDRAYGSVEAFPVGGKCDRLGIGAAVRPDDERVGILACIDTDDGQGVCYELAFLVLRERVEVLL